MADWEGPILNLLTRNPGKIREINRIFSPFSLQVRSVSEIADPGDVPETGASYAENALLKARRGFEVTGELCAGEDSGLEIDVLGGAPGLYSARFGGELLTSHDRNSRILELLIGVPPEKRTARFVCVVALAWKGRERLFEGRCEGWITEKPSGTGGFGYDPIFLLPPYGKTFAKLGESIKNRFSHRAIAFRACAEYLKAVMSDERTQPLKEDLPGAKEC
ncbi:MAG: RdgB/HAM1 family non-canonical purine NTP pyrophosphatase [Candidatus Atribacteria bacterium]|nr:RdgB/HAM1 family non-canonical purine NTP pyrophosphatase [Candidatus Atribacteria bacterium]